MFISKTVLSALIFCLSSFYVIANDHKIKDQNLSIEIDSNSCAIYVRNDSPYDNCKEFGNNPCKNSNQCVCIKKTKNISWEADRPKKFEIVFTTPDTPFHKTKCDLKSGDNNKVSCKVHKKGEYEYDVHVEGCEGKPYDPKIIVK